MANRVLQERIKQRLAEMDKSAEWVSKQAGLHRDALRNALKKGSVPGAARLEKMARVMDRSTAYLLGETDEPNGTGPAIEAARYLPIRHRLAAGAFREPNHGSFLGDGPAPPPDVYKNFAQWWEIVEDDSADEIYPAGALVRVVDAVDIRYRPRPGDLVIIERERAGLIERTLREIAIKDGRIVGRARSRNPRWQDEIGLAGEDEEATVRVVGLVRDAYLRPK